MPKLNISSTNKAGIAVLAIDYDFEAIQKPRAHIVTDKFTQSYEKEKKKAPNVSSCVISIKPEYSTSTLNNAIFELWKTVRESGGILVCVDYPKEYIRSLTNLGMLGLEGFALSDTEDAAINSVTQRKKR